MKGNLKRFLPAAGLLAAFILWTLAVMQVDVQSIGPMGSRVGFAALNQAFHRFTGVNWLLYHLTDWGGLIPVGVCAGFAALGLLQWIRRRSLLKVDRSLLLLGGFYLAVMTAYLLFEECVVNYRPVLVDGVLEASYPSSTTLLVLCVIPTAVRQLRGRIRRRTLRRGTVLALSAFAILMLMGRLISGVHWLSDVIGGCLLSAGLVALYAALDSLWDK